MTLRQKRLKALEKARRVLKQMRKNDTVKTGTVKHKADLTPLRPDLWLNKNLTSGLVRKVMREWLDRELDSILGG